MKVFLVDDEPLAVSRLRRLLEVTGRVEIAGTATDPLQAVERLRGEPVDVLFLDIEMPGLNGFELLARLEPQPLVVFTTAYDKYALRAFEVYSVDYLLKPVEPAALDRALAKIERVLGGREPRADLRVLVAELTKALDRREPVWLDRVGSRTGDRVEFIETVHITHFYAKDKLTYAATTAKHYAVDHTISELEQRLDPQRWLRIHRATLVRLDHIRELYTWFGGKLMVRLKDGKTELAVARDRAVELKQRLGL